MRARPGRVASFTLVLLVLIAAIFWPNSADGLLRLLLVALALGYIAQRAFHAMPPLLDDRYSPIGGKPPIEEPPAAPQPLRKLVKLLDAEVARARPDARVVPPQVRLILREEFARRLAEGYRLSLRDRSHHPRIRALVGETSWMLIRPPPEAPPLPRTRPSADAIPLTQLDQILDDLERL